MLKKIFAASGFILLVTGCFLPVISAPDRTFNLFDPIPVNIPDIPANAMQYAAISIIALAVLSIMFAFLNRTKFIWLFGVIIAAILTTLYFSFHAKIDEMKAQADKQVSDLFGGLFKGVTDSLFESIQVEGTGWYVLATGSLLLILCSFIPIQKKQ